MIDFDKIAYLLDAHNPEVRKPVVVLLSGGQDSVTCLGWAKYVYPNAPIYCLGFAYGQRHSIELKQAKKIAEVLSVPFKVLNLSALGSTVSSALVDEYTNVSKPHVYMEDVPASFVPARNALFLTMAHAQAQELKAGKIIGGMCQTDYSGYPDCREEFIDAMETALNIGYKTNIDIETPLMHINKAETFALADSVGVLDTVIEDSHTCYEGNRSRCYAWGCGCGECPACDLRYKGWNEYMAWKKNQS